MPGWDDLLTRVFNPSHDIFTLPFFPFIFFFQPFEPPSIPIFARGWIMLPGALRDCFRRRWKQSYSKFYITGLFLFVPSFPRLRLSLWRHFYLDLTLWCPMGQFWKWVLADRKIQKFTHKVNGLWIIIKAQNFPSQVLSRHTFKIWRKKRSDFFHRRGTLIKLQI